MAVVPTGIETRKTRKTRFGVRFETRWVTHPSARKIKAGS
jgi:hypothetical protein